MAVKLTRLAGIIAPRISRRYRVSDFKSPAGNPARLRTCPADFPPLTSFPLILSETESSIFYILIAHVTMTYDWTL